jgi:hypothetical protein
MYYDRPKPIVGCSANGRRSYVLKYSSRLQKELCKRYLFRAHLNLFLSLDKSLMADGR